MNNPLRIAIALLCVVIAAPVCSQQTGAPKMWGEDINNDRTDEHGVRIVGISVTGASQLAPTSSTVQSNLEFNSSDPRIVESFNWAKRQSLAFAYDGSDPVGLWYEAAEPGREAFCMRDTAHQAMGAHALGLQGHNLNMLRKFAENISDAKDWCSYWEIDRYDRPAPVDYENDAEFWYNLPANFDILDCCFRMYVWTGDLAYINDPAFLIYYDKTVNDYVERWGLGIDQMMKRQRILNVRGLPDPQKKFQISRGLPGYNEQDYGYVLGFDTLATMHAAFTGYARLLEAKRDREAGAAMQARADELEQFLRKTWWNEAEGAFYGFLNKDYQLSGRSRRGLDWAKVRWDNPDAANDRLIETALGTRSRKEYPEVPYACLGDMVNGMMGINLDYSSPVMASIEGFWVETTVRTLPGLGTKIEWAEIKNLPVRANLLTVRHEGSRKTTLTNQRGTALIWKATFAGPHENLLINGRPAKATIDKDAEGKETSWLRVTVGGGGMSTVEIPQ